MANSGCDDGRYDHLAGSSTGDGDGRRISPAARDTPDNVQCPDASSQPSDCLHLLCACPYVSCLFSQSCKSWKEALNNRIERSLKWVSCVGLHLHWTDSHYLGSEELLEQYYWNNQ